MSAAGNPRPAVIVRLGGGLGNQLFQYAFGRRMSLANNADLRIDASGYEHIATPDPERGIRGLGLDHFKIQGTLIRHRTGARPLESWVVRKLRKYHDKVVRLLEKRTPYYLRQDVFEAEDKHFKFDECVYNRRITGEVTFHGYWQTEKYFKEVEDLVRHELTIKDELAGANAELADAIRITNAVCIHVRHGDNANEVATALGILPPEYFRQAVSQLVQQVPEPQFFVFSEDIPWARQMLQLDFPITFVSNNDDLRNYEDLRLMSLCKHHILGNSTFSWWGAWLGKKGGQIVYAPRRYYQNIDRPNPDLYPETWRLI
jgi:hypothetical protein